MMKNTWCWDSLCLRPATPSELLLKFVANIIVIVILIVIVVVIVKFIIINNEQGDLLCMAGWGRSEQLQSE